MPLEILRTVNVSSTPPCLRAMHTPSNAWIRSLAPSLTRTRTLTVSPGAIGPEDVQALRDAGLNDGEILEVNQVAAYFAYANRTVTGLGVDTEGEVLGLSPDVSGDWHHG